jgi:hypothetical protein
MPELQAPQPQRTVDLERLKYLMGSQQPDDAQAIALVKDTFGRYESQRLTHERRWAIAANLYHGVVEERKWEGTDVKRASLPVPISFDQVEAAVPIITGALFNYYPSFFDVLPGPDSTAKDAETQRNVLASYFETPFDESGITPITHMKMAVKHAAKYGDGIVEISWDGSKKRPVIEFVDLRDVYFDPTTPGPAADWSPSVIVRKLMTVEDLASLRGTKGVKIPSDGILNFLAKSRSLTMGDIAKQREAAARKESLFIGDLRTDPKHQLIEVLQYWSKSRLIWVLGRSWCAINQPNPYGFIPYQKAPYIAIEGRLYGMSLPDILEGEQKYAQGIRNARLDNLALGLHPPRTRAQGSPTSPGATAWRPGLEDRVSDPKQVEIAKVENFTADAYQEEQIINQNADRRSGVNSFVQSGVPTASNANRTAGGVNAQSKAVSNRLSTPVENFEQFMIVPLLYKMQRMIQKFAPEQLQATDPQGNTVNAHKSVFDKTTAFRMEAGSRMRTKESLGQFLLPMTQVLFNPAVMHEANLQGMTMDFSEFARFFQDASGTSQSYEFFRPMQPQEQQALNQPDPKTMMAMQMKQLDAQTRTHAVDSKTQTEQQKNMLEYKARVGETGEKSAREILKLLQKDRADQWSTLNDANQGTETTDSGS